MTKIPSVEDRVEEKFNGSDIFWKVILKHLTPETIAFIKNDYIETLTAERKAVVEEEREKLKLKLWTAIDGYNCISSEGVTILENYLTPPTK